MYQENDPLCFSGSHCGLVGYRHYIARLNEGRISERETRGGFGA
jgi:hypothetical protein